MPTHQPAPAAASSPPRPPREALAPGESRAYFDAINKEIILARILSRRTPLTWILLLINVALFIGAWVFGEKVLHEEFNFQTWNLNVGQLAFYTGMKISEHVLEQGQWWRLISSAFVHMDITHILFNGYGLYVVGPLIERFYGKSRFIVIYFGTAILSALASLFLNDAVSGGASGALYGLVGAMLVLGYKYRSQLPERISRALTRGMLPWVIFGIGIGFFDFLPMDNAAHIGGLLSGALLALIMKSKLARPMLKDEEGHILGSAHTPGDWIARTTAAALILLGLGTAVAWSAEVDQCTESRTAYISCYPDIAPAVTLPYDIYMQQDKFNQRGF